MLRLVAGFQIHAAWRKTGERLDKRLRRGGHRTEGPKGRSGISCRVAAVAYQGKHNGYCVPTVTAVVCLSEPVCVCVFQGFTSSG